MNSRTLLNVGLVLAVAALAAVVYFQPGIDESEPVAPLLTKINPQQVKELRLVNEYGELLLQRSADQWQLQEPLVIAANKFRVDQLLSWLKLSSLQRYAAADLDLAKFGLDQPEAIMVVEGVEIRFGNLDPLNHRRYLLLGDQIHLVAKSDLTAPTSPWNYFVSRKIVPLGAVIKGLSIAGLGEISEGEKGWRYSGTRSPPASADLMQAMVDNWGSAEALAVEPLSVSDAHEQVVISFVGKEPPLTLMLVRGEDGLVLAPVGGAIEYHLSSEQGKALLEWGEPAAVEVQ